MRLRDGDLQKGYRPPNHRIEDSISAATDDKPNAIKLVCFAEVRRRSLMAKLQNFSQFCKKTLNISQKTYNFVPSLAKKKKNMVLPLFSLVTERNYSEINQKFCYWLSETDLSDYSDSLKRKKFLVNF